MMFVGDVHIYVSDFALALRFWADGLRLEIAEKEVTANSGYARLNFATGGSSIRLLGPVEPWAAGEQPTPGTRPAVRFDITTTEFDAVLARLLEHGGRQIDEIEAYNELRVVTVADPDGNAFELLEIREDDLLEDDEFGDEEEDEDEELKDLDDELADDDEEFDEDLPGDEDEKPERNVPRGAKRTHRCHAYRRRRRVGGF